MRWHERLRALRAARGWKQGEVAKHLGLRPNRYNQYEKGRRLPPMAVAIRIADLYGVDVKEIFGPSECHAAEQAEALHAAYADGGAAALETRPPRLTNFSGEADPRRD